LLLLVALPDVDAGALAAGTALIHLGAVQVGRRVPADEVLERLDWGVLVLFVGLFVLTGAIRGDAVFATLLNAVEGAGVVDRTAAAFGLSAVVSNVPAVLLLAPVTAGETEWLRLAAVSTLAGNATPVASAATLIVLERARRSGQRLSVPRLVAIGLPISVLTTLVAVVLV
jgi:Na+/H+ antiporter NhaD/arsenite permease-like protein